METTVEGYHLSPQQRRLWSLQVDGTHYNSGCMVRIAGPLNVHGLRAALRGIVENHEILRTYYHRPAGRKLVLQVIASKQEPVWRETDLRETPEQCRTDALGCMWVQERVRTFDLEHGPMVHATLVRVEENEYRLFVTVPALCADGWSLHNLVADVCRTYADVHVDSQLESLQYVQYSEWQNEMLETEGEEAAAAFLLRRSWDVELLARLLYKPVSPGRAIRSIESYGMQIPALLATAVECGSADASDVRVTLLAVWIALQMRKTHPLAGIALKCDGRKYDELQDTLGVLSKALPISFDVDPSARFSELVTSVRTAADDAMESDTYIPPDIFTDSAGETRYFPLGFEYTDHSSLVSAGEVVFTVLDQYSRTDRFDLLLCCRKLAEGLAADFCYDPALYSRVEVARIAAQFVTLLESAIARPDTPVDQLEMLPEEQRRQLIEEWNADPTDFPAVCVHTLFEQHAERTPNAQALAFEGQRLTYQQLNARANQLAHYLRGQGVGPGVLVALCMERSIEMIVGLLGVLKAGGAYVALDPAYPPERIAFLLQDSRAPLLLTQEAMARGLPPYEGKRLAIDGDAALLAEQPVSNPDPINTLSDPVYVIYTSGSTGTPKGVMVEHGGLTNYVHAVLSRLDLPAGSRYASVSTLAADLGNTVVFGAL